MDSVLSLLRRGWPLLLLALVLRVAQIIATGDWTPVSDPADYVRHAVSISHGHGMADTLLPQGGPSALRPPAYPYFLGLVFAVSGDSETAGRLASALLGVVTVAMLGVLAQLLWSRRAGLVAMALAAAFPPFVLLSGTLLSESLAAPIVLGLLILVLLHREAPRPAWVAPAAGLLFGLALLDRPALVMFGLPLIAGLWRPSWRGPATALVVAGLAIVPWTIRNAVEFDAFVPISTQSGFLVAGTYNATADRDPVARGAYRPADLDPALRPIVSDRSLDENEVSRKLSAAGRDYATDNLGYVAAVFWLNGRRILGLSQPRFYTELAYRFQGIGRDSAKLALYSWYLVALGAIAGILLGGLRRGPWWLWLTPVLLFVSVIGISGDIRYRAPIEWFVVLLAAFAVAALTDRRRGPQPPPT